MKKVRSMSTPPAPVDAESYEPLETAVISEVKKTSITKTRKKGKSDRKAK